MPQLQLVDQALHRHQVTIGLPPQRGRLAECADVTCMAEGEHQPRNVGTRVAALQETLPGFGFIRLGLFQRKPRLQITQWHLQGLACIVQVLGIPRAR
ncbi:hypothetical protein NMB32_12325 [Stenotrophomonas sp. CD2]|nr:hypothetical protein NMB32_12325 [Stenotrophomonas sp. CD2]